MIALNKLAEDHLRFEILSENQATQSKKQIMTSLDKLTSLATNNSKSSQDKSIDVMANLASQFSALAIDSDDYARRLKVINSLHFETIFERPRGIVEAYPTTFEWLFADVSPAEHVEVPMLQWLKTGNGKYWVSGKAGSGKSTLMKFLVNDRRIHEALSTWAGEKRLIIASYFFWNAGTNMQKSQHGLLQTLLYTVLQQWPPLVSQICQAQLQKAAIPKSIISWTKAEILDALKHLRMQTSDSTRLCFLVDGLDEFDGDHTEILAVMEGLASDHIKICFSSRPWNVFQDAYGTNGGLKLELQNINKQDIERFVEGSFSRDSHFCDLKVTDNRYDDLVLEIVERASGVFLWVFLVVQSLRRGMSNSDTISELQDRLRVLPTELEDMFQHILDSVEKVYHKQAARIYLIRLVAPGVLTAMTVSFFDEKAPNFAFERDLRSRDPDETGVRMRNISRRILARCKDLIEVSKDHKVGFLHRTVHDFLRQQNVQGLLVQRAGADFDAHQYICNALLSQVFFLTMTPGRHIGLQRLHELIALTEDFIHHACEMDLHSGFTNVRLLEKMDSEVGRLREEDSSSTLTGRYHKNWLIQRAVQRGLYGYLCQKSDQVRALIEQRDKNMPRSLLDFALRPMKALDPRVVSLLLENGADPNELCGEDPIWRIFLGTLTNQSGPLDRTTVKIIEILLMHGAAFTVWDSDGHVDKFYFRLCTFEEIAHLESVCRGVIDKRCKRQRGHTVSSQRDLSKRPRIAAVQTATPE